MEGAQGIHISQKGHESDQVGYTDTCLVLWDGPGLRMVLDAYDDDSS